MEINLESPMNEHTHNEQTYEADFDLIKFEKNYLK
jgi:hypothetical protein